MQPEFKYQSLTFSPIGIIKLVAYAFAFPSLAIFLMQLDSRFILYLAIFTGVAVVVLLIRSYSLVSYDGKVLKVRSYGKEFRLSGNLELETWWSYDFGVPSYQHFGHGEPGESIARSNRINCYVKFATEADTVYIYEQISLSDKFPNNHTFLPMQNIDRKKLVKVWDIDRCLGKLQLQSKRQDGL